MKHILWSTVFYACLVALKGFSAHVNSIELVQVEAIQQQHIAATTQIILDNLPTLMQNVTDAERERIRRKWPERVLSGQPMSSSQVQENSFRRRVLLYRGEVMGVVDYFIRADDKKGYIETLAVKQCELIENFHQLLITDAVTELKKLGSPSILTHVFASDELGVRTCLKNGFRFLNYSEGVPMPQVLMMSKD
jgi:hypothetical protein